VREFRHTLLGEANLCLYYDGKVVTNWPVGPADSYTVFQFCSTRDWGMASVSTQCVLVIHLVCELEDGCVRSE
jgi:hypothetical protein